jgi:hypothetical protein
MLVLMTYYCIQFDEGLSRSIEAAAKRLVKLDWPTSLLRALENGNTRELYDWEVRELHTHLRELCSK